MPILGGDVCPPINSLESFLLVSKREKNDTTLESAHDLLKWGKEMTPEFGLTTPGFGQGVCGFWDIKGSLGMVGCGSTNLGLPFGSSRYILGLH